MEKWFVWKDEKFGFQFGPEIVSKDKNIVEECDSYEDARQSWGFYCYLLHKVLV
jgi:hypothetical protein